MRHIVTVAILLLALSLLLGAAQKVFQAERSERAVATVTGPRAASIAVSAAMAVEIFLGSTLLFGLWPRLARIGAFCLLLFYSGFIIYLSVFSKSTDGGCPGARMVADSTLANNTIMLGRNVAFMWILIYSMTRGAR
jgi:uncharacterized membrane protein YphA (DoxX/SURF4 family)